MPTLTNMFAPETKTLQGKVIINEMPSPFNKNSIVRRVIRNTADDAVVANEMQEQTDIVKKNDITPVMSAFVKSVQLIISKGNAVRISGLGTFYIKVVPKSDEDEEDTFEVSFTADKKLNTYAQKVQAELVKQSETEPQVETVDNMYTMTENSDALTSGMAAIINGKRLRIAGDSSDGDGSNASTSGAGSDSGGGSNSSAGSAGGGAAGSVPKDGTGLYLVPCDDYGGYKVDRSDWIRVENRWIGRNVMTQVVFRVPEGITGHYRIAISTRAPLSGSKKEELLIKKARCSVSKKVFEVGSSE